MILRSLYELYDRLSQDPMYEIAPIGYSLQKIAFRVVLKPEGTLYAIEDARIKDAKGKPRVRQVLVPGHTKPPGSGLNPCFLWDTSAYMLGYKPDDEDPSRTAAAFQAFKKRHLSAASEISSQPYQAVCQFLDKWEPSQAVSWPVLNEVGPGYGIFQIIGETSFVHNDSAVQEWWLKQQGMDGETTTGQCLVTGATAPISRILYKIKKVGSQGDAQIVSFNAAAYESYGKEQSFNAPISEDAAFRYATALNALLDGPMSRKHRFSLGDATVVFWTREPTNTEDVFAQFATNGFGDLRNGEAQDEAIRQKIELFLKALRKGREAYADLDSKADQTSFYLLGLTGQARGRIGVRFFYRETVGQLLDNLRRHYADISIVRRFGEGSNHPDPEFPALWQILDETCPRRSGKADRKQIPPILEGPLLRAVIAGTTYPAGLFSAVLRRIHADRELHYVRACVIAGYLRRNMKEEVSMSLDVGRKDPAYRLGRLFAVLERMQESAHWQQTGRNLEKGIRDNFFSAACSTPASVFPRLERLSTHHRRQLSGGQKHHFDQLISDIKDGQIDPPSILSLREQGAFLLGYYHQWKNLRTKKETESTEQESKGE